MQAYIFGHDASLKALLLLVYEKDMLSRSLVLQRAAQHCMEVEVSRRETDEETQS